MVGLGLGVAITYPLQLKGFDISTFYEQGVDVSGFAIDTIIYAQLSFELLAILGGVVFLSTMLISVIPMRHVARIRVAEVIR